jgi:hypothetical protein
MSAAGRSLTDDPKQLAREVLTSYWTARERDTPEAWGVCRECLARVLGEPCTAADVMAGEVVAEMAALTVIAIAMVASAYEVEMPDAFAEFLRSVGQE